MGHRVSAQLKCHGHLAVMPRSTFRGHIGELLRLVQAELPLGSHAAETYPQTAAAIVALREAVREEWGLRGQCVSRKRSFQEARDFKRMTAQLYWLRKTRPHKARRADPTRVKNMMDLQWMARVGLARPSASLRSFSVTLRDLCGEGSTVTRTQIGRIRDAFVQTLIELRVKELTKFLAAELRAPAAATGAADAASATCAVASQAATGAFAS